MIGIFIAILSAVFMMGMQILLKKSYKELNPSVAFIFDMLFGLIIWIPIGFFFGATLDRGNKMHRICNNICNSF